MEKILIEINAIGGLYSFRKELVQKLIEKGYIVVISAPYNEKSSYFMDLGCKYIETPIDRRSANPITDSRLLAKYMNLIKEEKPKVVLTYTIKPNVYGGIACRLLGIPCIANITGLGTSIENKGLIGKISLILYKIGLSKAKVVFFQNTANRVLFTDNKIVKMDQAIEIPGSGVNVEYHNYEDYPVDDNIIKLLYIGRIMKAKGIDELFKAIEKIKQSYSNIEFHIIGGKEENYDERINELVKRNFIIFHGSQEDVRPFLKNCHAIINPSHHEGMSNVLLEAASTGRPVLASNIPGCKETFDEGISGFGFESKNSDSLVKTIIKFIELPFEEKKLMGFAGRLKIEKQFDRNIVVNEYMNAIHSILNDR